MEKKEKSKYGQIVEWVDHPHGLPVWRRGRVLDVIPAGDYLRDRPVVKERGLRVSQDGDVSIYDRVLVEVYEPHGRHMYCTPRLARIRRV